MAQNAVNVGEKTAGGGILKNILPKLGGLFGRGAAAGEGAAVAGEAAGAAEVGGGALAGLAGIAEVLTGPVGWAIAAVTAGVVLLYKNWDRVTDAARGLGVAAKPVLTWIADKWDSLTTFISPALKMISQFVGWIVNLSEKLSPLFMLFEHFRKIGELDRKKEASLNPPAAKRALPAGDSTDGATDAAGASPDADSAGGSGATDESASGSPSTVDTAGGAPTVTVNTAPVYFTLNGASGDTAGLQAALQKDVNEYMGTKLKDFVDQRIKQFALSLRGANVYTV